MFLAFGLSLAIGLLLGLLGGGGSVLTVPVLVYILHVEPRTAILTSFTVIGVSSLIAIAQHARRRRVCWKSGFFFGLAGMVGAYYGGRMAMHFSNDVLMALFGLFTLAVGIAMLSVRRQSEPAAPKAPVRWSLCPARSPYARLMFDGFFVGVLTGLIGVSGGFLVVPALTLLVGLPMPVAVGTSLLIVAMNALAGLGGYLEHARFDIPLTAVMMSGTITGSLLGGWLSHRMGAAMLRKLFGLFVVLIAAYVLYRSVTVRLLADLAAELTRHREFVLGVAALAGFLILMRIAAWIHRPMPESGQSAHLGESSGR
ncbi:sulfite exporter TauE/SafE family protein [Methylococcus sp. EFPC2]|nr:sulfite exporter TauE/SafE family protein [Methylococcus sp. EFPC2]